MPDAPHAVTTSGEVVGRWIDRGPDGERGQTPIATFFGIPFAASADGDRRWRPPAPVEPWDGIRDCTRPGLAAVQIRRDAGGALPPQDYDIGEDCLNLNVHTPAVDDAGRPVFVWIHGGSYQNGRGANNDGTFLSRDGDLVVVTVNYRMGLLGFSDVAWLDPDRAGSHNLGIQDQIAALRWVRDNIAGFGGDPNQVTICGESAGAGSVLAVLASPAADGLFHQAISQSAPAAFGPPSDHVARLMAEHADAETIDDLLALTADEILEIQTRIWTAIGDASASQDPPGLPDNSGRSFRPAIDGITVTRDAAEAAGDRGVPLLLGTNDDEGTLFSLHLDRHMDLDALHAMAATRVGDRAGEVIAAYQAEYPDKTPHQIAVQWMGDLRFWTVSLAVADAATRSGTSVHVYRFAWKSKGLNGRFGAMHALEIPFVFGSTRGWEPLFGAEPPPTLGNDMHRAWINYTRTGDPSHDGIGEWPAYDLDRRPTMRFGGDDGPEVIDDPGGPLHRVWENR